ncbi:MAG: TRAP transporter substrate-binding protein DctP [Desulfarculaceae bacterium]
MKVRAFTSIILVWMFLGFFCLIPGTAMAKDKVFNLKVCSQMPPGDHWSIAQKWYFDNIAKLSKGRIKVQYFWSGSLVKVGQDLHAINKGLADVSLISPGYTPTELPIALGLDMAYTVDATDAKSRAIMVLYQKSKLLRDEWEKKNSCKLLFAFPSDNLAVYSKVSMPNLKSIKGHKIRTYGMVADAVARLGGTPVSLPISECYEAASRGIIDAASGMGLASAWNYKMYEPCPYIIDTGYGQYCQPWIVMNIKLWNKLPKDLQALMTEWSPKVIEYTTKLMQKMQADAIDDLVKRRKHIQIWSEQDKTKAKSIVQPAQYEAWITKQGKLGHDTQKVKALMMEYIELLKKYDKESKFVNGYVYWQKKYGKK